MQTDSNIKPVTQAVIWRGNEPMHFAFIDHDGESYTLCLVDKHIDIYRNIEGDECRIGQVDQTDEALNFISIYASQLIG
jgi:hypothetical protein